VILGSSLALSTKTIHLPCSTMGHTFVLGEITSRSTAPLHRYLLAEESEKSKNDKKSCLFTEIKASVGIPAETDAKVIDESFIDYQTFLKVIDNKNPSPPPRPETVRALFLPAGKRRLNENTGHHRRSWRLGPLCSLRA
jgi:hypothetical protein